MRDAPKSDTKRRLGDNPSNDHSQGWAPTAKIQIRCANCWGAAGGQSDGGGRLIGVQCRLCGRSVDREDAEREIEGMRAEAALNLPRAQAGRGSKYREDARFVLKILPDMDRDKTWFDG